MSVYLRNGRKKKKEEEENTSIGIPMATVISFFQLAAAVSGLNTNRGCLSAYKIKVTAAARLFFRAS